MSATKVIPAVLIIILSAFGIYEATKGINTQLSLPRIQPRPRGSSSIKVSPQRVLDMLASQFHVPAPRLILTEDMPQMWRAYYAPDEDIIYLRPSEREPLVVAHEYGHKLHTALNIPCGGRECEKYAGFVEKHYVKVLEPRLIQSLTQGTPPTPVFTSNF